MSTTKEHTLRYTYYDREDEMPAQELELVKKALAAREKAYAQYSGFMVGAAILLENGIILTGNNQENAAYPFGAVRRTCGRLPRRRGISGCKDVENSRLRREKRFVIRSSGSTLRGLAGQAILEYSQKQGSPIEIIFAGTTLPRR